MTTPLRQQGHKFTRNAGAAIAKRRILKFGANDENMVQAAAATDLLIGVSDDAGDIPAPSGSNVYRVDVIDSGIVHVDCGGTVALGAFVTSDANGKAVAAAPAAGANVNIIGQALSAGVNNSIISIHIVKGVIQGPAT